MITSDELPYGKSYKLYIDGFIELDVSTAAVYDTNEFEQKYTYDGNDLGANYTAEKQHLRHGHLSQRKLHLTSTQQAMATHLSNLLI